VAELASLFGVLGWSWLHIWLGSLFNRRWAFGTIAAETILFFAIVAWLYPQSDNGGGVALARGLAIMFAFFIFIIPALLCLASLLFYRWFRSI
jgi:hypothetical protein